jgi:nucleotide-binding universal stress UspA family protein
MTDGMVVQPILVPVDFSPDSEAALQEACRLAECLQRPLMVLHVVHDPADMPGYYAEATEAGELVHIEDAANKLMERFLKGCRNKYPDCEPLGEAESLLVVGLPVTRILEVAEKARAEMIVMGSKGRTGLRHLMLGSKAEQVVRMSPRPVMIVKADASEADDS